MTQTKKQTTRQSSIATFFSAKSTGDVHKDTAKESTVKPLENNVNEQQDIIEIHDDKALTNPPSIIEVTTLSSNDTEVMDLTLDHENNNSFKFETPPPRQSRAKKDTITTSKSKADANDLPARAKGNTSTKSKQNSKTDTNVTDSMAESEKTSPVNQNIEVLDMTSSKRRVSKAKKTKDAQVVSSPKAKKVIKSVESPPKEDQQETPTAVVDPAVLARIQTYQQKIDDILSECHRLYNLTDAEPQKENWLRDIYGMGVDIYTKSEKDKANEAHESLFTDFTNWYNNSSTDFPASLKAFVAERLQGGNTTLSTIAESLLIELRTLLPQGTATKNHTELEVALTTEIKMLAQRTSYGIKAANANLYEDSNPDALWRWEVGNIEIYFPVLEMQKVIKRMRKHRRRLNLQLKSLSRVVQLLSATTIDENKVNAEEVKIGKFYLAIEAEVAKAQEKASKEDEKRIAHEKKVALEAVVQKQKDEEDRKRKRETEAMEQLELKRKKTFVTYFKSIDSQTQSTNKNDSSNTKSPNQVIAIDDTEKEEVMSTMDAQLAFLSGTNTSDIVAPAAESKPSITFLDLLSKSKSACINDRKGPWNSRKRRDPKLGVMKLLQFHENYRPAYFGTCSQALKVRKKRGRQPFATFAAKYVDYSVDSDDEWEEEEPGESLSDVGSEDDGDEEDALDYEDQWLAYEDEIDYMDGEEHDKDELGDENSSNLFDNDDQTEVQPKKRKRLIAGGNKTKKLKKLEPKIQGPFWCPGSLDNLSNCIGHFNGCYSGGRLIVNPSFVSPLIQKANEYELQQIKSAAEEKALKEASEKTEALKATVEPMEIVQPPKEHESPQKQTALMAAWLHKDSVENEKKK